jgi:putative hydrolase of the HAD superfamily
MIKCVIFDIDDTLYLERDYVRSGFMAVDSWLHSNRGVESFFDRAWLKFEDGLRGNIFDQTLLDFGIEPTSGLIEQLVSVYRSHVPKISLLSDAQDLLDRLKGTVALAVVTDGPAQSQRQKVSSLGLWRWMNAIVYCCELGPDCGKPSPKSFDAIQMQTGYSARQCVYVADNPVNDFAGPKFLNWVTVRIRRPGGLHYALCSGDDVDVEIETLDLLESKIGLKV